jgi:hypothetical protein
MSSKLLGPIRETVLTKKVKVHRLKQNRHGFCFSPPTSREKLLTVAKLDLIWNCFIVFAGAK